jgi:hypothetical protein
LSRSPLPTEDLMIAIPAEPVAASVDGAPPAG